MKQFPFDKRYEIEDASGVVEYYIDGDEYIRGQDGIPGIELRVMKYTNIMQKPSLLVSLRGNISQPQMQIFC